MVVYKLQLVNCSVEYEKRVRRQARQFATEIVSPAMNGGDGAQH